MLTGICAERYISQSTSDFGCAVLKRPPEGPCILGAGLSAGPGICAAKYSIHSNSDFGFDSLNLPPVKIGLRHANKQSRKRGVTCKHRFQVFEQRF